MGANLKKLVFWVCGEAVLFGVLNYLGQVSPLWLIVGGIILAVVVSIIPTAYIDEVWQRELAVIKGAPVAFSGAALFTALVGTLVVVNFSGGLHNPVKVAEVNPENGRRLIGDARRAFIQQLQAGYGAEGKVILVAQEYCNECNDFLADIHSALQQTEVTSEPWYIKDIAKGPPSGITVNGPKNCDDKEGLQAKLAAAFKAADFSAICKNEVESSGDAWVYVSETY